MQTPLIERHALQRVPDPGTGRIAAGDSQAADRSAVIDQIDDTEIRKTTRRNLADACERLVIIEGICKSWPDLCKESLLVFDPLLLGDVADHSREHCRPAHLQLRNRGICGKLRAGLA